MKKVIVLALVAMSTACAYGGVATQGDRVVITKNNGFLFGALNTVYVCKVTDNGVTSCQSNQSP